VGKTTALFLLKKAGSIGLNSAMDKLTPQEQKLIELLRKIRFGEVRIIMNDGVPTRVEEVKKSIKL